LKTKFFYLFFSIAFLLVTNSSIYGQAGKLKFGAYGEILYQHYNYGMNQRASPTGSLPDNRSSFDIPRFIFKMEYFFTDDIYFESEVEFEHLGTGSALELEYEEFGEYEFEAEKGGEVLLEEFHITKKFSNQFSLRVGRMIVPVGLLSRAHNPNQYFTSSRPESVSKIIPTIWNETGIELFGSYDNFDYRFQVVNGLESSGFSSENWVVEGHQRKFELVKATDLAFVGRLDYNGIKNIQFGISGYRGNTSDNRPKPQDLKGIDGNVTIYDLHAVYNDNDFIIRGNYIHGNLENSDLISITNSRISTNIQSPRTPVAKEAVAYYVEAGYNVLNLINEKSSYQLFTFGRYEYYNSMEEVAGNVFADSRFKRNVITYGINFFVLPNLVIKADYSIRKVGGFDSVYRDENTFGLSISFNEWFIK
jgi:phosphate-selective porin O/P